MRGTRVLLRGKEYVYPLEMLQVLFGVSPLLSARILFDYSVATIKSFFAPAKKEDSFEEWGVRNLGRTLYDLCFGIYSARVWGLPTSQISSKQAQRVAKLNLEKHHPAHARHQGGSDDVFHEILLSARRASASCSKGWPRKCGPPATQVLLEFAGGSRRARGRSRAPRRVYTTAAGEQSSIATSCCRRCRFRRW